MLFESLSPSNQHMLTSYLDCWKEFVENYEAMLDEKGKLSIDLFQLALDNNETMRLRSIATILRQLAHTRDICGFDATLTTLDKALDESELSVDERKKKQELFDYLLDMKEKNWDHTYVVRANPRKPEVNLTAKQIMDIVHHEYIMHNQPLNKCYYKQDYPTLSSCPVILDYTLLLHERAQILALLAKMIYHYQKNTFFELKIIVS